MRRFCYALAIVGVCIGGIVAEHRMGVYEWMQQAIRPDETAPVSGVPNASSGITDGQRDVAQDASQREKSVAPPPKADSPPKEMPLETPTTEPPQVAWGLLAQQWAALKRERLETPASDAPSPPASDATFPIPPAPMEMANRDNPSPMIPEEPASEEPDVEEPLLSVDQLEGLSLRGLFLPEEFLPEEALPERDKSASEQESQERAPVTPTPQAAQARDSQGDPRLIAILQLWDMLVSDAQPEVEKTNPEDKENREGDDR